MAERLLDFDVGLVGDKPIIAKLGLAEDRVKDLRPAWAALHSGNSSLLSGGIRPFVEIVKGQYRTKGARGGTPWQSYNSEPVYKRIKIAVGGGLDRMLRWEAGRERLYPSLVRTGHPDHVYEPRRLSVMFGTRVPYAIKHQEGRGMQPYDRIPLPKRPIIALTRGDFRGWIRVIQRHVEATVGIRGARAIL